MKTKITLITALLAVTLASAGNGTKRRNIEGHRNPYMRYVVMKTAQTKTVAVKPRPTGTKIQVALLLDTSNSMDGLIEQAKSRLWNIVNTLTTLKYNGQTPNIEISLY